MNDYAEKLANKLSKELYGVAIYASEVTRYDSEDRHKVRHSYFLSRFLKDTPEEIREVIAREYRICHRIYETSGEPKFRTESYDFADRFYEKHRELIAMAFLDVTR
jgi:hypothetical protein